MIKFDALVEMQRPRQQGEMSLPHEEKGAAALGRCASFDDVQIGAELRNGISQRDEMCGCEIVSGGLLAEAL